VTQTIPRLRRIETSVLKNKSGSDPAQVPATASITVYRQGVVARATISIPPHSAPEEGLPVADVGSVRTGDTLWRDLWPSTGSFCDTQPPPRSGSRWKRVRFESLTCAGAVLTDRTPRVYCAAV
jgi:hypothetical protein